MATLDKKTGEAYRPLTPSPDVAALEADADLIARLMASANYARLSLNSQAISPDLADRAATRLAELTAPIEGMESSPDERIKLYEIASHRGVMHWPLICAIIGDVDHLLAACNAFPALIAENREMRADVSALGRRGNMLMDERDRLRALLTDVKETVLDTDDDNGLLFDRMTRQLSKLAALLPRIEEALK